jgi:hypothetical protein
VKRAIADRFALLPHPPEPGYAKMGELAEETAYYVNSKILSVALILEGVPFPRGVWIRVAEGTATSVDVEEMRGQLFPRLKGMALRVVRLMSESDVADFERSLPAP